jgi:transcriptional regulator with XRE-family HTH domain
MDVLTSGFVMKPLKKLLGSRLKQLRQEQDLQVERVAEWVRVDRTHIYNVERGEKEPSIDLLSRLATAYHVDMVDLFTFPEEHVRHRWRELARIIPNAKLASLVAMVEAELGESLEQAAAELEPATGNAKRTKAG